MSGDVPLISYLSRPEWRFSPRERGCSNVPTVGATELFSFPRVSGDVPLNVSMTSSCYKFSPRERGCSGRINLTKGSILVFPA